MTRTELLAFLTSNPGAEAKEIATHFGITNRVASARMPGHLKAGYVVRKEVRRTLSNIPVYGYWVNERAAPTMTRKERVETTVSDGGDISDLIAALSTKLAKQIAAQVVVDLQVQLQRELASVIPPMVQAPRLPEPVAQKAKLPKVGITNLLPQQAGLIQQEFCDTFDLTFWNGKTGDGMGSLRAMGSGCWVVFHHVDHSSHAVEETLKAVGAKVIRVSGGMTALRDALTKYYVETA